MVAAAKGYVLAADKLGKWKTTFQDIAIVVLIVAFGLFGADYNNPLFIAGAVAFGISVVLTIVSGVHYLVANRGVFKEEADK